ncbi:MAG TPA: hypothetical protein VI612_00475 [Candidatus Nanoarchaeia archaeon]|nr:hypothetical protein [Candidatus Nanoarchaeia archaeon]
MIAVKEGDAEELLAEQTVLAKTIKHYQKTIEHYMYTMGNLAQKFQEFLQRINEPNIVKEIWNHIQDVNTAAVAYRIQFLSEFERLLQKMKHYIDLRYVKATKEQQKKYSEFYNEIERYKKMIDDYAEKIEMFTDIMTELAVSRDEFKPKEQIKANIETALTKGTLTKRVIVDFAEKAPGEAARQLTAMRYMVDKTNELISPA